MNRTRPVLTDTVPIQTIRALHPAPSRRARPNTTGRGWHHGATQPIPVIVTREHWMSRMRRLAGQLIAGLAQDSPAQQRALDHIAMQRLIGR